MLEVNDYLTYPERKKIKSTTKNVWMGGFSGGSVVKNPPCNVEDMGSIPDWGTKIPHASEQLSLCTMTAESPALGSPCARTKEHDHCVERSHTMQ